MTMNCVMFLTVWMQLVFACFRADSLCRNELINRINITTDLQSDVLLPCIFKPTLLGTNLTADIAAVWSHKTITEDNLVEIKLQGDVMSWNIRGGRIQVFPTLSRSGNFSLLLYKLNESDQGLYRCQLFKGINCSIAYQEMLLIFRDSPKADGLKTVLITAGALGGGLVLLSLMIITKRNRRSCGETVCNTLHSDADHTSGQHTVDNPIYDAFIQTESDSRAKEEEGISPDIAVYAIVKKKKKSTNWEELH